MLPPTWTPPQSSPTRPLRRPLAARNRKKGTNTPSEEKPTEGATSGENGDSESITVSRLERMPKADLEQMAQDMGVDISGAKNNHERAELIAAAMDDEDGETFHDELEDEDIVR